MSTIKQFNKPSDLLKAINDKRWQICFDSMRREGSRRVRHHNPGWDRRIKTMVTMRTEFVDRSQRQIDPWKKRLSQMVQTGISKPIDPWARRIQLMIDTWWFRPKPSMKKKNRKVGDWDDWAAMSTRWDRLRISTELKKDEWSGRVFGWVRSSIKRKRSYARGSDTSGRIWTKAIKEMISVTQFSSLNEWEKRLNEFTSHANRREKDRNERASRASS